MELKFIQTKKAPAAIGPYSQAITAGSFLFISGQLGLSPETGELVGSDMASQARQVLENMTQILKAGGCELKDVVSVDVFLTNMTKFVEFNGIYEEYFLEHKPARAAIEISALPKNACIEIKCIACRV